MNPVKTCKVWWNVREKDSRIKAFVSHV
jgi:hypothetical protein